VGDDLGDGRPQLVVISYDAETVRPETQRLPQLVERIFEHTGSQDAFRQNRNNLVFLVADEQQREIMKQRMVRRLALDAMRAPDVKKQLAEHQQEKLEEYYQRSEQELAIAIQQCYRHLFFPSRTNKVEGTAVDLAHTSLDIHSASERPGSGQVQVLRALSDNRKLLRDDDAPLAPMYVRDRTPLKKGQITTAALRAEFRRDPALPVMIGDQNFVAMVRKGIEEGVYVYRGGELLVGQSDPPAEVKIDEQSFIFTMAYAREQSIWPRPAPAAVGVGVTLNAGGGAGAGGSQVHGGPSPPVVNLPGTLTLPLGARTYRHEAPLREALTRIWEEARRDSVERIAKLSLRVFETTDAFRLLSAVGGVSSASKKVQISAAYETSAAGVLTLSFAGTPEDAAPLKEFLEPQFRAASEHDLQTIFELAFTGGLALDGAAPEDLTERLTRFASGAALVEAWAEEKT
jgi:hypothetical protein